MTSLTKLLSLFASACCIVALTGCTLDGESATTDNLFQSTAAEPAAAEPAADTSSNDSGTSTADTSTDTSSAEQATTTDTSSADNVSQAQDQSSGETAQTTTDEAAQAVTSSADSNGSAGSGGGFVWKPVSEGDGNLVVLLPAGSSATSLSVNGSAGSYVGRTNGERPTFRFGAPGCAYGSGVSVVANDGFSRTIANGCSRQEG